MGATQTDHEEGPGESATGVAADSTKSSGAWCSLGSGDDEIGPSNESAISLAVAGAEEAAVADLLTSGADPNSAAEKGSVLFKAALKDHLGIVNLLLEAGADPNSPGPRGLTPMMSATHNFEIVGALLDCGADPNTSSADPDQPFSVLSLAVGASRHESVRVLLDAGADPQRQSESSALMKKAAEKGDVAVLEALIAHGVPVDVPDHEAWTPLMEACHWNQLDAVRFLIACGANVNAATLNNQPDYLGGSTPLITAAKIEQGKPTALSVLLDSGAELEAADCSGGTALKWAAMCGSIDAVKLLLDRGANPNSSAQRRTILDFAVLHGRGEVVELLVAAGAVRWEARGFVIRSAQPDDH